MTSRTSRRSAQALLGLMCLQTISPETHNKLLPLREKFHRIFSSSEPPRLSRRTVSTGSEKLLVRPLGSNALSFYNHCSLYPAQQQVLRSVARRVHKPAHLKIQNLTENSTDEPHTHPAAIRFTGTNCPFVAFQQHDSNDYTPVTAKPLDQTGLARYSPVSSKIFKKLS
ncbi:hypothetical protein AOLI_G00251380 [Acnodon oligacanthus]